VILCVSPAVALADPCPNKFTTVWTYHGTGDWFTSSNWSNGVPICANGVSYDAKINNGYTAQINTGSASACEVSLGVNPTDSGTLSVDSSGSSLTTCSGTLVGYQGKGNLSITNGGVVTTDIDAAIAWGTTSTTSSNGAATVDGTRSTWAVLGELDVGGTTNASGGTGLLTVTNGGTVSAANVHLWQSGTLTGNGTVSTTSGMIIDGTLKPSGQLTISGSLTLHSSATTQSNVVPTGADNVQVSAGASLDGRLSVTMTGTFTPGTTYTLLHASSGRSGTFRSQSISFPTCQCFTPVITYDANNAYLYLDPAPCCE
jgi:T5SS/PEP-CTERM-associated repeat protein